MNYFPRRNKHVSVKLRLKFFNAVLTPPMLVSLSTFALTKIELEINSALQREVFPSIVRNVQLNGTDGSDTMQLSDGTPIWTLRPRHFFNRYTIPFPRASRMACTGQTAIMATCAVVLCFHIFLWDRSRGVSF